MSEFLRDTRPRHSGTRRTAAALLGITLSGGVIAGATGCGSPQEHKPQPRDIATEQRLCDAMHPALTELGNKALVLARRDPRETTVTDQGNTVQIVVNPDRPSMGEAGAIVVVMNKNLKTGAPDSKQTLYGRVSYKNHTGGGKWLDQANAQFATDGLGETYQVDDPSGNTWLIDSEGCAVNLDVQTNEGDSAWETTESVTDPSKAVEAAQTTAAAAPGIIGAVENLIANGTTDYRYSPS